MFAFLSAIREDETWRVKKGPSGRFPPLQHARGLPLLATNVQFDSQTHSVHQHNIQPKVTILFHILEFTNFYPHLVTNQLNFELALQTLRSIPCKNEKHISEVSKIGLGIKLNTILQCLAAETASNLEDKAKYMMSVCGND